MSTKKRLRNSRLAKFEDKRIELFIVQSKLNNKVYKLQNLEEKILLKYNNSNLLKVGLMAQLAKSSTLHRQGQWFESGWRHLLL